MRDAGLILNVEIVFEPALTANKNLKMPSVKAGGW